MDFSLISETASGITQAIGIVKSIKELGSNPENNEKIAEVKDILANVSGRLTSVISLSIALYDENGKLRNENEKLKNDIKTLEQWSVEKIRYKLTSWPGLQLNCYGLIDIHKKDEPPHNLCANCYETGFKSILQPTIINWVFHVICPRCKTDVNSGFNEIDQPVYC